MATMSAKLLPRGSRFAVGALPLLLLLPFLQAPLLAQEPPLLSGQQPGQGQPSSPPASANGNEALSLLLDQNIQLRTELQALRGLVEEQGFALRRLQGDSLNRYTSIDERLQALENEANPPALAVDLGPDPALEPDLEPDPDSGLVEDSTTQQGAEAARGAVADPASTTSTTPGALQQAAGASQQAAGATVPGPAPGRASSLRPAVLSEQQLYQIAYESAINANFERSVAEFDQYLSVYPEGRFVSNAHYWKGQAYLYLSRFGEARDSYQLIVDQYGDSPKLADAIYGLGQAYQGLGDSSRARELFEQIKRDYPNTGVANLADTRLLSLD